MERITRSSYFEEIESLAKEALADSEGDLFAALDWAREAADAHQWIIYTRYHQDVIDRSEADHPDLSDLGIDLNEVYDRGGLAAITQVLAYSAMLADLEAEIAAQHAAYEEEDEEDED